MAGSTIVELSVVGAAAFATSVLSALAGLGGGVVLLAVLAQFQPTTTAIPVHGVIQFVSNGSRAWFLVRDVSWPAVWRSSLLLFPGALLGVAVATSIPENLGLAVLGVFALVVAWWPGLLRWKGRDLPRNAMIGVGAASGFLNTTIGVSGPVTSPFFKAVTTTHVSFVATAAAAQVLAHTSKVAAYFLDGWRPGDHLALVAVGVIGVALGSRVGTRLMGRLSESALATVFRVVLSLLALRLVILAVL